MDYLVKSITGYPNYLLYSDGRIYNSKREKFLKSRVVKSHHTCYRRISLCNKGQKRSFFIHRLVAEAFIPNPHNLPFVRHLNGDSLNNQINNLAWGTAKDNEADKLVYGSRKPAGSGYLDNKSAPEVIDLFFEGKIKRKYISESLGLNYRLVSRIIEYETKRREP